jgi:hypothetical protein
MSDSATRANALDHVVVVLFENRSLDNLLGRLYGPEDGKTFEGVIGRDLTNPIPDWAEHGVDRKVVPYGVATDMDSPVVIGRGKRLFQDGGDRIAMDLRESKRLTTGVLSLTYVPTDG